MDSTVLVALLTIVGTALGGLFQWLRSRPREKAKSAADARAALVAERQADAKLNADRYDQLQQDLAAERRARESDNERMTRDIARQAQINEAQGQDLRVTTDYASYLRQWIEDRKSPPPPEWPLSLTKRREL